MILKDKKRFESKIDKRGPDDCWEWQAHRQYAGYGRFNINGKMYGANRLA
jgi:hypothetical protein